jgi:hypothetical protein
MFNFIMCLSMIAMCYSLYTYIAFKIAFYIMNKTNKVIIPFGCKMYLGNITMPTTVNM